MYSKGIHKPFEPETAVDTFDQSVKIVDLSTEQVQHYKYLDDFFFLFTEENPAFLSESLGSAAFMLVFQ